ncbi:hypothetical protein JCM10049v2_006334 [Rhodotorula toruloides]
MDVVDGIKAHLRGRLNLLPATAKEAFVQQVHYIDTWLPDHPLPSPDRLLINADLGGRYLQLLRQFHTAVMHSAPNEVDHRMQEFQDSIPFTFFASLPLDLSGAVAEETLHAESILRYAVLVIYHSKLNSIISVFAPDPEKRKDLLKWRTEHLDEYKTAMRTSWRDAEEPNEPFPRNWRTEAAQQYWSQYGGVILADWSRLQAVWTQLVESYSNTKRLPAIDAVQLIRSGIEVKRHSFALPSFVA